MASTSKSQNPKVPYRQIRADYNDETITVYQAYSSGIATAAVKAQKLSASSGFSYGRMTWIKPSWCWMMYRCGYSYKDNRQTNVLAIKMKHEHFLELLQHAVLTHGKSKANTRPKQACADAEAKPEVKVQWDPERSPSMERLSYRSIQIGIPRELSKKWVEEWIVSIEDVTDRAKKLKAAVDKNPNLSVEELVQMGLHPVERPFELPEQLKQSLEASEE